MKLFRYLTILAAAAMTATACQDSTEGLGLLPEVSEDMYRIYIDENDPNLVHFAFTADLLSPYWEIELKGGSKATSNNRDFTLTMTTGDYTGYLTAYGRSGRSPRHEFTFHIDAPDPAVRMLCGTDPANPKVWVWDIWGEYNNGGQQRIFGYIWGDDWRTDTWYNPLEDMQAGMMQGSMLDDKMTFFDDGRFLLDAGGTVWVDGDVDGIGGWGVDRAGIAQWQPKGTEGWALVDAGTKRYIRFSGGGFPSVVADPKGVDADYEIVELSEEHLRLRWWRGEGDGIEFNFVPEGYQGSDPEPPTPPEPGPGIPEQETVTPISTDSPEYLKLTSYSWKMGALMAYIMPDGSLQGFDTPDFLIGDLLNFNTDGRIAFSLGDDTRVFDNENGAWNFTPQGTEGFVLGHTASGALAVQFTGGGFPIAAPVAEYADLTFEVLRLTDTDLQLGWAYKDYNTSLAYFVLNFSATAKQGSDPEPPTPPEPELTETERMLTAHTWVANENYSYYYGEDNLCETPAWARDDELTFLPDGKLEITCPDGLLYADENPAQQPFAAGGKEAWEVTAGADGKEYVRFSGGGTPMIRPALAVPDPADWEIMAISENQLRLGWPYGDGGYLVVILDKKQ